MCAHTFRERADAWSGTALDGDWSAHTPAEQAAFAFARKLTHEPHRLAEADFDALRPHFTDLQILEMAVSVARNNVSNRWKEAIGVPQRADEGGYSRDTGNPSLPRGSYLTPTSERFQSVTSLVAPVQFDSATGEATRRTVCVRPALESVAEVEAALASGRSRTARLPLVDEATARSVLSDLAPAGPLPQWMLLLANFPRDGVEYVATIRRADEEGAEHARTLRIGDAPRRFF